jgi:hypothetical protein
MDRAFGVIIMMAALTFWAIPSSEVFADDKSGSDGPPDRTVNWDMVSDTVSTTFNKANAILSGNLDVEMDKPQQDKVEYTTNAIGQRVPKATAVKAAGSLHNDEPL